MIVKVVGEEAKPTGPSMPLVLRILDHPKAPYSHDQIKLEILDHEDLALVEMTISRSELCRAVRAFEVQSQKDRGE